MVALHEGGVGDLVGAQAASRNAAHLKVDAQAEFDRVRQTVPHSTFYHACECGNPTELLQQVDPGPARPRSFYELVS